MRLLVVRRSPSSIKSKNLNRNIFRRFGLVNMKGCIDQGLEGVSEALAEGFEKIYLPLWCCTLVLVLI